MLRRFGLRARVALIAAVALCLVLSARPSRALAWTQTRVTGVSAQLVTQDARMLRVTLEVKVQVIGGWLSQLELVTADPALSLASDAPAQLTATDGTLYTPTAALAAPGVVVLAFANRHAAPSRGAYVARLTYDTPLTLEAGAGVAHGFARARWRLPSWDVQLPDVRISVQGPRGMTAAVSGSAEVYGDRVTAQDHDALSELVFERAQLARTQSWEVAFNLPGVAPASTDLSADAAAARTRASRGGSADLHELASGLALGLALAALGFAKRRSVAKRCRERGLVAHALFGQRVGRHVGQRFERLRASLGAGACMLAGTLWQRLPLAAGLLAAVGVMASLDRQLVRAVLETHDGTSTAASSADLKRAARSTRHAWLALRMLDATTLPGALGLAAVHAAYLLAAKSELGPGLLAFAWLATPLWLTSTRKHEPVSAAAALQRLVAAQATLAVPSLLQLRQDADGRWLDAQLELQLQEPGADAAAACARLRLVVADATLYGRSHGVLAWLATSDAGSTADHALALALPSATLLRSADCKRHTRLQTTSQPGADAQALLGWLRAQPQARAAATQHAA